MSLKRLYKIDDISFIKGFGFFCTMEENMQVWANCSDRNIKLLFNGEALTVKYKGVASVKMQQITLVIASWKEEKNEILEFLGVDNHEVFITDIQNACLEVEFVNEKEIQEVLSYELIH